MIKADCVMLMASEMGTRISAQVHLAHDKSRAQVRSATKMVFVKIVTMHTTAGTE
jgi:hypothetical protein